jgi:hypothetical protein
MEYNDITQNKRGMQIDIITLNLDKPKKIYREESKDFNLFLGCLCGSKILSLVTKILPSLKELICYEHNPV